MKPKTLLELCYFPGSLNTILLLLFKLKNKLNKMLLFYLCDLKKIPFFWRERKKKFLGVITFSVFLDFASK